MKLGHLLVLTGVAMFLLVLIPVFLYGYHFGLGLWNTSSEWADLGSFFGGVLSPILTFFSTLLLLLTIYFTHKTLKVSQEAAITQVKQLELTEISSASQIKNSQSVRFDSIFFNQLSMVHQALNSATYEKGNVETKAHESLLSDFQNYVTNKKNFDVASYQAPLSQAIESFDQLVKMVESFAPQEDKNLYRDLVKYNISIHFRWWVGQSWKNVHPDKISHRKLLAEKYGAVEL